MMSDDDMIFHNRQKKHVIYLNNQKCSKQGGYIMKNS